MIDEKGTILCGQFKGVNIKHVPFGVLCRIIGSKNTNSEILNIALNELSRRNITIPDFYLTHHSIGRCSTRLFEFWLNTSIKDKNEEVEDICKWLTRLVNIALDHSRNSYYLSKTKKEIIFCGIKLCFQIDTRVLTLLSVSLTEKVRENKNEQKIQQQILKEYMYRYVESYNENNLLESVLKFNKKRRKPRKKRNRHNINFESPIE